MPEISLFFAGVTLLAGLLMFFAPCTFPLVPAFLTYISGKEQLQTRRQLILNALAFCAGFSSLFILLGFGLGFIGSFVTSILPVLNVFIGITILLLGVSMLPFLHYSFLKTAIGFPLPKFIVPGSPVSSFGVGVIFALGFSPCIGPVMASVLLLASTEGSALAGGLLLAIFSIGFSAPFLITAWYFSSIQSFYRKFADKIFIISYLAPLCLILIGGILIFGGQELLFILGSKIFYFLGLDFLYQYY